VALHESHGTGTALGDPIEVGSLTIAVLNQRSATAVPVVVGSLKANIGHAEAASGASGMVTLALGLNTRVVGPNVHLHVLNMHVHDVLGNGRNAAQLPSGDTHPSPHHTHGGVSSFGYSGTIVHAVLGPGVTNASTAVQAASAPPVYKRRPQRHAQRSWPTPPLAYRRRAFPWSKPVAFTLPRRHESGTRSSPTTMSPTPLPPVRIDLDMPLMAAGLTSTNAVRFSARLRTEVKELDVSPTLIFEFPTVRAINDHLAKAGVARGVDGLAVPVLDLVKDMVSASALGRSDNTQPQRVADCLVRVNPGFAGRHLPPLVGAPMIVGSGAAYSGLALHISTALYYCEHPTLSKGNQVERVASSLTELAAYYAMAIRTELVLQHVATFGLIGGSWGGLVAHQIAIAARRTSFAPRSLVLLDPTPPLPSVAPNVMPNPLHKSVAGLVTTVLAAADVGGRHDTLAEISQAVQDELANCNSNVEAISRGTQLLVDKGVLENNVESTVKVLHQAQVMNQSILLACEHLAMNSPPPAPAWQTLLVLASERLSFFVNGVAMGVTLETAGAETARLYGGLGCGVTQELVLYGDHLAVIQGCANAEDAQFIAVLRRSIESGGSADDDG